MLPTAEPDAHDLTEEIGERIIDALERLAAQPPPVVQVAPAAVQMPPPVVRLTLPAARGFTCTVTSRDADGNIRTLELTPK